MLSYQTETNLTKLTECLLITIYVRTNWSNVLWDLDISGSAYQNLISYLDLVSHLQVRLVGVNRSSNDDEPPLFLTERPTVDGTIIQQNLGKAYSTSPLNWDGAHLTSLSSLCHRHYYASSSSRIMPSTLLKLDYRTGYESSSSLSAVRCWLLLLLILYRIRYVWRYGTRMATGGRDQVRRRRRHDNRSVVTA
jgi:hypothetical protein